MNHDDYLILCGLDALDAQLEADLAALDERDRLAEYAPASVLPLAVVRGQRRPEGAEHRRVRTLLYGQRSGTVDNVVPIRLRHSFQPMNIDAAPGPDRPDAA